MSKPQILLIHVENIKKGKTLENLLNKYSETIISSVGTDEKKSKFIIKVSSDETKDSLKHEIEKLDGIIEVFTKPSQKKLPKLPKSYSAYLMMGLIIVWISIIYFTFLAENNPLEKLTNSQLLVIEITIALAISVWVFIYDKKSQNEIIDVLANIHILSHETNLNVKDFGDVEN